MRKAFAALVKTDGHNGGPPRITNWVAKVGIHDEYPTINPHATKARMYKACGHVLRAFQLIINRCTSLLLNDTIRQKIKAFELHFGWCHNCLEQVGLDDQGVPQTPSRPTNIFNAIPLPSQPTQPVASTSLLLRMAEPADCAGTHASFRDVGKSKRTKTPTPSPYARTARPAPPPPPINDQIKLVDCGIVLYQLDKLKRTDIMCRMLQVNVLQPNLYLSLQRQLWELFSPSLLSKNLVESLPQDFLPHTNLSHKKM
ncbi:hypothetical protein PSTG_06599 [Puccinia striiformis f. sp. tritici PST-78]|uniref:Uncharacterized protein n=1 Tax=Puccinia striiformis f. sp. tritici PST-78 TaxID=1165861 RepID=A0A0L0VLN5_9BASI|nr:hypothetical protein PSTG_06599 [Puccinia striiformis f. sp. tritici PST-78]